MIKKRTLNVSSYVFVFDQLLSSKAFVVHFSDTPRKKTTEDSPRWTTREEIIQNDSFDVWSRRFQMSKTKLFLTMNAV